MYCIVRTSGVRPAGSATSDASICCLGGICSVARSKSSLRAGTESGTVSAVFSKGGNVPKLMFAVFVFAVGCGGSQMQSVGFSSQPLSPEDEPPMRGIHWIRGFAHGHGGGGSPLMTWHGGDIMTTAATQSIFWGTNWANSSFVGDKITGLDTWYSGFGSSHYSATSNEYTGTNGQVTSVTTYPAPGHFVDTSPGPSRPPATSTILTEVCTVITNPVSNGYYAVYTDLPRGSAGYCAWHSFGSCGSVPVQFAFFFSLDGDPGCDPGDSSGLHSQGLAALSNVSGHELSEARSPKRRLV